MSIILLLTPSHSGSICEQLEAHFVVILTHFGPFIPECRSAKVAPSGCHITSTGQAAQAAEPRVAEPVTRTNMRRIMRQATIRGEGQGDDTKNSLWLKNALTFALLLWMFLVHFVTLFLRLTLSSVGLRDEGGVECC